MFCSNQVFSSSACIAWKHGNRINLSPCLNGSKQIQQLPLSSSSSFLRSLEDEDEDEEEEELCDADVGALREVVYENVGNLSIAPVLAP